MKNTINTNNKTNTTNTNSKEETTMTNTRKTNRKFKRMIASMLAAVMVMTTAATIGASANTDAVVNMNTRTAMCTAADAGEKPIRYENGKIILDDDMNKVKDITAKTIFAILDEVPGAKFFTPALEGLLDSYVGTVDQTQLKLDEINSKLDTLFEKIDKMEQSIKNLLQNELNMTAFYTAYVNFKADAEYFSRKINETMNSKTLSNVDKLAKIGSLAGSFKAWKDNFDKSLTVLNTYITDTSLGTNTSIFDVVYNNSCANVMFANEAIVKAKPVCEAIVQTYTAGCTAILECLAAQLYVNNLSDDMRAQINSKYLDQIDASNEEIINEIQSVSEHVTGEYKVKKYYTKQVKSTSWKNKYAIISVFFDDTKTINIDFDSNDIISVIANKDGTYDVNSRKNGLVRSMALRDESGYDNSTTFAGMYEKTFRSKSKTALVNHGLCNIDLAKTLFTQDFKEIPKKCNAGDDSQKEADKQVDWFNENVVEGQISGDYVKDIAAYAASKGKTIRQLLNENGFDTSNIKKDTYIITAKAFSKCYSSSFNGFEDKSDAIFRGINIDANLTLDKNGKVSDQEVKFWKVGWEGLNTWLSFTTNRWNSSFDGNCCIFQIV